MIEEIKQRISCVDYLARHGIHIQSGGRCVSPLRPGAQNPTSFYVTDEYWHDYGSSTHGDVIDLAAQLHFDGDNGAAIRHLADELGIKRSEKYENWKTEIQRLCNRTAAYQAALTQADYDYLASRGLTREDADRLRIGRVKDGALQGRLFLPYFKNEYVCYYATRAMPGGAFPDSKYRKAALSESPAYQHIPWGLQTLNRASDTLVISEGYFDAAVWEREGYPVLSPITGNFSKEQWPEVLSACRMFKRVFIIFDNDAVSHAGDGFTARTSQRLFQHRIPFIVGHTPDGVKDVNDYYVAGGNLQALIDNAVDGLSYLCDKITDMEGLKNFLYPVARYCDSIRMEALFDGLRASGRFSAAQLKALQKQISSVPPESQIVNEVSAEHDLIYIERDSFYEWNGRIWNKTSDYIVEKYAGDAYGFNFRTAQRMKQIRQHLYSQKLSDVEFNKRNLMNFPNGTLELDTGIFREHRRSDYCSFAQSYAYDPEARCPRWEQFIQECTNDDPKRMEALQMIMGYVMLADCRYQLMFLLMGKGGNGKSVYLDVMKELYGAENCTTVDPEQMNDNFQRILLRDSLVNYASEISGDMTATVKWVKSVACGEQINGCYKGKDNINFTTRCKLIFSCNSSPKAGVIEGLDRRLFFIDFPCKFTDFPDPTDPLQRLADRDIIPKLLTELPGIFNWAYEGYKLLQTVKYFTETNEQAYYMQRFKETSNPVTVFCDDYADEFRGMIQRDQIYGWYTSWCLNTGHKPMANTNFFPAFCSAMGNKIDEPNYRARTGDGTRSRFIVFNDALSRPDPEVPE